MQSLNESLIKEVKNLKQEKSSKGKLENDESREELKKKDEEIKRLHKHNQELLNDVKNVKRHLQEVESKIISEEMSKIVEEALDVDDIKEEMQARIEEGRNKLMENITI
jgi:arginine/glutamate-rich protein 1